MEESNVRGEYLFKYYKDEGLIDKYIRETEFTRESILDYLCEGEKDKKSIEPYINSYLDRLLEEPLKSIEVTKINETGRVFYKQTELAEKLLLRI